MSLLLAFAILFPTALAADLDGDGVDGATDCDDANPLRYLSESSTTDYTINSSTLSSFCTGYCSREVGDLTVVTDSVAGLECVRSVDELTLSGDLTSLTGFGGLQKVHTLIVEESSLKNFTGLTSLTDLDNLYIGCYDPPHVDPTDTWEKIAEAAGDHECDDVSTPSLTSLNGLGGVTSLETLIIWDGERMTSLNGLNHLTDAGTILLYDLSRLTDLTGLDSLTSVDHLVLVYLTGLTSMRGLGALDTAGSIRMVGPTLTDLRGLDSLRSLDKLHLWGAGRMLSLRGLEGLTAINEVELNLMPTLRDLHGLDNVTTLGQMTITGAPSLTSLDGLESLEEVEALYLGCQEPEGALGGVGCYGLPKLESLEALSGATQIGDLELVRVPALKDLSGLEGLTTLDGLTLDGTGLVDLTGFPAITEAAGTYQIGCHLSDETWTTADAVRKRTWTCLGNPSLVSLDGMETLTSLQSLHLGNNGALEDVSALGNLETLTSLQVANNPALSDLSVIGAPLTNTSSIMIGCLDGSDNTHYGYGFYSKLYACDGASATTSLPQVAGTTLQTLALYNLPRITSLDGLYPMSSGSLIALEGLGLTDLRGLEGLTSVTWLWIGCHPYSENHYWWELTDPSTACSGMGSLTSLDGLDALTTVGDLQVSMNRALSDIDALTGLTDAYDITFRNNYSLTTSYINATIAEIDRVTGTTTVSGSAP